MVSLNVASLQLTFTIIQRIKYNLNENWTAIKKTSNHKYRINL